MKIVSKSVVLLLLCRSVDCSREPGWVDVEEPVLLVQLVYWQAED